MIRIQENTYGGEISKNSDGRFTVFFLYNMSKDDAGFSRQDIHDRKSYASEKTAIKKIKAWIASQSL